MLVDENKQLMIIKFSFEKECVSKDSTEVILENVDPNITIDYENIEIISDELE